MSTRAVQAICLLAAFVAILVFAHRNPTAAAAVCVAIWPGVQVLGCILLLFVFLYLLG